MKVMLEDGAYAPTRAHATDAGLDLYAMEDKVISPMGNAVFKTGVHVELPAGTCGILISKSGLNIKNDIVSTGLIDEGYTGEIKVKLYNHSPFYRRIEAGNKISQLIVIPALYEPVEVVDSINQNTDRGPNGFGSTGK